MLHQPPAPDPAPGARKHITYVPYVYVVGNVACYVPVKGKRTCWKVTFNR